MYQYIKWLYKKVYIDDILKLNPILYTSNASIIYF